MDPVELELTADTVVDVHTGGGLADGSRYTLQNQGDGAAIVIGAYAAAPNAETIKGIRLHRGQFATITAAAARPLYALAAGGDAVLTIVPA